MKKYAIVLALIIVVTVLFWVGGSEDPAENRPDAPVEIEVSASDDDTDTEMIDTPMIESTEIVVVENSDSFVPMHQEITIPDAPKEEAAGPGMPDMGGMGGMM